MNQSGSADSQAGGDVSPSQARSPSPSQREFAGTQGLRDADGDGGNGWGNGWEVDQTPAVRAYARPLIERRSTAKVSTPFFSALADSRAPRDRARVGESSIRAERESGIRTPFLSPASIRTPFLNRAHTPRAVMRMATVETATLRGSGRSVGSLQYAPGTRSPGLAPAHPDPPSPGEASAAQRLNELARSASLEEEVFRLRAALEQTRENLDSNERARTKSEAEAQRATGLLADAQRNMVALHSKLLLSRQTSAVSTAQCSVMARDATSFEEEGRLSRMLLLELVTNVNNVLGVPVPREWLNARKEGSASSLAHDHVLACHQAVRTSVENSRAQAQTLKAHVAELKIALKQNSDKFENASARGKRPPAENGNFCAARVEVREIAILHGELGALRLKEGRAQAKTVQLRLALAASHAELEAHRTMAVRGDKRRGSEGEGARTGWTSGLSGMELVELMPPLEAKAGSSTAADMPESLIAHVRGVPYRLSKLTNKVEMMASLLSSLPADVLKADTASRQPSLVKSASSTLKNGVYFDSWQCEPMSRPGTALPFTRPGTAASIGRPSTAQLLSKTADLTRPMEAAFSLTNRSQQVPSSPAVRRRAEKILINFTAIPALDKRPFEGTVLSNGQTPASATSANALRQHRQLLANELSDVWGR